MPPAPPDYDTLIDAQTWAFIQRTGRWYPPDTTTFSIQRQRTIYDAMCREFHRGYPEGITAEDDHTGIATRHYRFASAPGDSDAVAQIVYFHGGGFVVGGLDSHDDVCAELCAATGFPLTSVDYRLCPEYPHPAAFLDALSGVEKARRCQPLPILLCGDSAGANLAAAVAHQLRAESQTNQSAKLAGQVLIYPGLGGDTSTGSYQTHANAPLLTTEEVEFYSALRLQGSDADVTFAPLLDSCFAGLPDTFIVTAQCDPLSDDGRVYRDAIVSAGGNATWINETGLVHGYLRARSTVSRAHASFIRITDALSAMGKGEWTAESGT